MSISPALTMARCPVGICRLAGSFMSAFWSIRWLCTLGQIYCYQNKLTTKPFPIYFARVFGLLRPKLSKTYSPHDHNENRNMLSVCQFNGAEGNIVMYSWVANANQKLVLCAMFESLHFGFLDDENRWKFIGFGFS